MKAATRARSIRRRIRVLDTHWIWIGATDSNNRPVMRIDGRLTSVVRLFYEAKHGPLPPRCQMRRYRCSYKLCVRPDHYRPTRKPEPLSVVKAREDARIAAKLGLPKPPVPLMSKQEASALMRAPEFIQTPRKAVTFASNPAESSLEPSAIRHAVTDDS